MFSKRGMFFIVVALLAILIVGCAPKNNGNVAATVNDVNISLEDFEAAVNRMVLGYEQDGYTFDGEEGTMMLEQIRQHVIHSLVQEEVLLQASKEKGYEASKEDVDKEFEDIKSGFESEEDFEAALKSKYFTEESFKNLISNNIQIRAFLENETEEVEISEDEVLELYEQYKQLWAQQSQDSEEDMDIPGSEELKAEIEELIRDEKQQEKFIELIEQLMEKSKIEIFI